MQPFLNLDADALKATAQVLLEAKSKAATICQIVESLLPLAEDNKTVSTLQHINQQCASIGKRLTLMYDQIASRAFNEEDKSEG